MKWYKKNINYFFVYINPLFWISVIIAIIQIGVERLWLYSSLSDWWFYIFKIRKTTSEGRKLMLSRLDSFIANAPKQKRYILLKIKDKLQSMEDKSQ